MSLLRTLPVFIFLFVITVRVAHAQEAAVDAIVKREMNDRHIPGLQLAVVQQGKIVLLKSYGYANLQDSVPVSNKSIFAINSCTKTVTGTAVMQLVEEGKLDLSHPVSRYVDSLPAEWQNITIKQLLTHISGLPDLLRTYDPVTRGVGKLGNDAAAWQKVKTMPMPFRTGEQFSYNQTNYALLGMIIEKLSGKSFVEVFQQRQFNVVGMPNTRFGDSRDVIPHFAPTYSFKNSMDGVPLAQPLLINSYAEFSPLSRTASGLNSTAEDLAHWIIALQQGKLLGKEALKTMWQPGMYNNGTPTQWALGWGITKQRARHRAVGMSGGGRSAFLVYPDDALAVVVLTNLAGGVPEEYLEEIAGCYHSGIATADAITLLRTRLQKQGYAKAAEVVAAEKKKDPSFQPDENELNDWAYRLMSNGKLTQALEIFKLNTTLYPQSWNVYDSYGEALLKNGQRNEGIAMYKRSLQLNPDNAGGKRVLERMVK